jgi:uncharacterized membrane protein
MFEVALVLLAYVIATCSSPESSKKRLLLFYILWVSALVVELAVTAFFLVGLLSSFSLSGTELPAGLVILGIKMFSLPVVEYCVGLLFTYFTIGFFAIEGIRWIVVTLAGKNAATAKKPSRSEKLQIQASDEKTTPAPPASRTVGWFWQAMGAIPSAPVQVQQAPPGKTMPAPPTQQQGTSGLTPPAEESEQAWL